MACRSIRDSEQTVADGQEASASLLHYASCSTVPVTPEPEQLPSVGHSPLSPPELMDGRLEINGRSFVEWVAAFFNNLLNISHLEMHEFLSALAGAPFMSYSENELFYAL